MENIASFTPEECQQSREIQALAYLVNEMAGRFDDELHRDAAIGALAFAYHLKSKTDRWIEENGDFLARLRGQREPILLGEIHHASAHAAVSFIAGRMFGYLAPLLFPCTDESFFGNLDDEPQFNRLLDEPETFLAARQALSEFAREQLADFKPSYFSALIQSERGAASKKEDDVDHVGPVGDGCEWTETIRMGNLPLSEVSGLRLLVGVGKAPGVKDAAVAQAETEIPVASAKAMHSVDFRSVNWFGDQYRFTQNQAACIKLLWESWENGCPEIADATILEAADIDCDRLQSTFRSHPAWGKMIVSGSTKGTRRLAPPPQ